MAGGSPPVLVSQVVPLPRLRSAQHHASERQVAMHVHDAAELVFTRRGDLTINVEKHCSLPGKDGTIFILPANVPHDQVSHGKDWHTLCILYYHGHSILDEAPRTLQIGDDPLLLRWIDDLCAMHQSRASVSQEVFDGLLFTLLQRLASIENSRKAAAELHPRLADAVRFLHEHLTDDVEAEELAEAACTSYSHLSALFRERFGVAPLKYHQKLRMEMAGKLLLNPYLSVDEVAAKAGFDDTNYFVRLFRKTQGLPPGKWRKEVRIKN